MKPEKSWALLRFLQKVSFFQRLVLQLQRTKKASGKAVVCGYNVMAVVTKSSLEPEYLFYLLIKKNLSEFASTGNPPSIRKTTIEGWEIPLPLLDEQKRIAAILSKADRLRRLCRYARELSDGYLQSVFLEVFGDPVSNPRGWEVKETGTQINSIRYGTGSPPPYQKDGIPFIRATNIKKGDGSNGKSIIQPLSHRAGQPHINAEQQVKSLKFPTPPTKIRPDRPEI